MLAVSREAKKSRKAKTETEELLAELKKRQKEIENLKKALGVKKVKVRVSVQRTKSMLEEIKVPELKLLKEKEEEEE